MSTPTKPQRLTETLTNLRQALEEVESALLEFEETLSGEEKGRSQEGEL